MWKHFTYYSALIKKTRPNLDKYCVIYSELTRIKVVIYLSDIIICGKVNSGLSLGKRIDKLCVSTGYYTHKRATFSHGALKNVSS